MQVYCDLLTYKEYIDFNIWLCVLVGFMVFNTTFNNISVISWRSVLLVEETREPGGNHQPATSH